MQREKVLKTPSSPGVYIFLDESGPIYVGKATNIRARLLSHFSAAKLDYKEKLITKKARKIKFIKTDSDFRALLLEAKLINLYKPRYNIRGQDDKSNLYIQIDLQSEFPKICSARYNDLDKKSKYFGPFPSQKAVLEIIRYLRKIIPFCTQKRITKYPCFYSKIGLCSPCPNYISSLKNLPERNKLKKIYRQNIAHVVHILEGKNKQVVISLYRKLNTAIKKQNYETGIKYRNQIKRLEYLIREKTFRYDETSVLVNNSDMTESLRKILQPHFKNLKTLERIEAVDISNLQNKFSVGSLVTFVNGIPDKASYKRFKVKENNLRNDFDKMAEIISRRFSHNWPKPDLLIVDGGRPQIMAITKVLDKLKLSIPLIGIAKEPDRLIVGRKAKMLVLPLDNKGFNLVRAIRDESHRFAKKYHLLLRSSSYQL